MSDKMVMGSPIKFIGGKYAGKTGWINLARGKEGFTNHRVHVILDEPRKCACVKKNSIGPSSEGKTLSYEEAILDQKPFINKLMNKLAHELAKANVNNSSMAIFGDLLAYKIAFELEMMQKNPKASYYKIDFPEGQKMMAAKTGLKGGR